MWWWLTVLRLTGAAALARVGVASAPRPAAAASEPCTRKLRRELASGGSIVGAFGGGVFPSSVMRVSSVGGPDRAMRGRESGDLSLVTFAVSGEIRRHIGTLSR